MNNITSICLLSSLLLSNSIACLWAESDKPIPIKVVIVVFFEVGEITGDETGEFQLWVEREGFDKKIPFSLDSEYVQLRTNDQGVLILLAGMTWRSGASVLTLGMDPRFDLTRAYWLAAGIAGVDPADASLGSAAWAEYVIDAETAFEVHPSEAPADWAHYLFPWGAEKPNELPPEGSRLDVFPIATQLNPDLVQWAYNLTKSQKLKDNPDMQAHRKLYVGYPNAQKPPFVLKGDSVCSSRYFVGHRLTSWANDWDRMWTKGKGNFVMGACEDHVFVYMLTLLDKMQKVDFDRVLVLRTGSDMMFPPPGVALIDWAFKPYPGMRGSVESAHQVGSTVVHAILANWDRFENDTPGH